MAVADSVLRRNVVCPFCGLACDDLTVAVADGRVSVREGGCEIGRAGFERPIPDATPLIAGAAVTLDEAVARAAEMLLTSHQPLFAGLGVDVAGVRAVLELAERTGGIVDHVGADGLFRNLRVVQDSGWMTTTLSEVRNHADFVLIIGPDPTPQFPRFFERCIGPPQTLYADSRPMPPVVRLGPPRQHSAGQEAGIAVTTLPCPIDRLPEVAAALRCLVNGRPLHDAAVAGVSVADLRRLADRLKAARYGVVTWMAGAFDFADAELLVQSIADLVRDVNQTTRCAALPLAGSDNVIGANQVCTWQAGVPLRTSFGSGVPQHDSRLYATSRLVDAGEIDALVWISAFRPIPPPSADLPTVVIAAPGAPLARTPEVSIPVSTPGIDHAGDIFRTDAVVALPLAKLRTTRFPSAGDVLARIQRMLRDGGGA
jgi:formylmethanofuran dehydrogenase subunit B